MQTKGVPSSKFFWTCNARWVGYICGKELSRAGRVWAGGSKLGCLLPTDSRMTKACHVYIRRDWLEAENWAKGAVCYVGEVDEGQQGRVGGVMGRWWSWIAFDFTVYQEAAANRYVRNRKLAPDFLNGLILECKRQTIAQRWRKPEREILCWYSLQAHADDNKRQQYLPHPFIIIDSEIYERRNRYSVSVVGYSHSNALQAHKPYFIWEYMKYWIAS